MSFAAAWAFWLPDSSHEVKRRQHRVAGGSLSVKGIDNEPTLIARSVAV
jgi:hypothetical protein